MSKPEPRGGLLSRGVRPKDWSPLHRRSPEVFVSDLSGCEAVQYRGYQPANKA